MKNLKVIFEDNHIIVVEKPVNMPSQADKTGDIDMLTIIKEYLKEKYNKPGNVYLGLIHRLDRPVGGVMVFAKTSKAAARLSEQVREKIFKKTYLVVVNGKMEEESGTLEDYLLKNESEVMSMILTEYDEELHNETLREEGREDGIEEGIKLTKTVFTLHISGKSDEEISQITGIALEKVKKVLY